ncbi:MAG: flavodoxin [Succinivibrio sp.]
MKHFFKAVALSAAIASGSSALADTLVVYYSATGCTQRAAEIIAKATGGSVYSLTPEQVYSDNDLNWRDENSRVSREHNDESLRDVKLTNAKVADFSKYDTVFIGYPIWWGIAAWPVNTFIKENSFKNKRVITFATSVSSPLGDSSILLEQMADGGLWLEGKRFQSYASEDEIAAWAKKILMAR